MKGKKDRKGEAARTTRNVPQIVIWRVTGGSREHDVDLSKPHTPAGYTKVRGKKKFLLFLLCIQKLLGKDYGGAGMILRRKLLLCKGLKQEAVKEKQKLG